VSDSVGELNATRAQAAGAGTGIVHSLAELRLDASKLGLHAFADRLALNGKPSKAVPTSPIFAHLVSFLFHLRRPPSPTNSVAGCPVAWLSPRFISTIQPSDY